MFSGTSRRLVSKHLSNTILTHHMDHCPLFLYRKVFPINGARARHMRRLLFAIRGKTSVDKHNYWRQGSLQAHRAPWSQVWVLCLLRQHFCFILDIETLSMFGFKLGIAGFIVHRYDGQAGRNALQAVEDACYAILKVRLIMKFLWGVEAMVLKLRSRMPGGRLYPQNTLPVCWR